MNILFLAPHPFFQYRGTPIAVRLMLRALASMGHCIHLITYPEGEDVHVNNCHIDRIPRIPGVGNVKPGPSWKKALYDAVMAARACFVLRKKNYHLVHAVEEAGLIAVFLKKTFKIPFVYDMDSVLSQQVSEKYPQHAFLKRIFEKIEALILKNCSGVIPVCRAIEDRVRQVVPDILIQRVEDVSLITEAFTDVPETLKINDRSGPVIMYVGNLEKYQGIDLLIKSFKLAEKEVPDAELVIIGGDPKSIERYKRSSRNRNVSSKIRFLGPKPLSMLPRFYDQADILVSPRISGNNTPMKIYSYMDSGKALLATRLPTHTQVLDNEVAYLADPDEKSMARGMVDLIQNPKLRDTLSKNAKMRVKNEFTVDAFEKKVKRFYREIEKRLESHELL